MTDTGILDKTQLNKYRNQIVKLISIYMVENDISNHNICVAWEKRDRKELKQWAHKMAGSAKTIGAKKVHDIALKIEGEKNYNDQELSALVDQLNDAYQQLKFYINAEKHYLIRRSA